MDIDTFPQMLKDLMLRERPFVMPCSNYYEASALIREAVESFWNKVKEEPSIRDDQETLDTLLNIAVHCWRVSEDLELVHADSASETIRKELHTERQRLIETKLEQILNIMQSYGMKLSPLQKGESSTWGFKYDQTTVEEIKDILEYQ